MKAKVKRGSGFRGLLNYALSDGKRALIVGGNMSGKTPRVLAAEFGICRAIRPDIGRPVVHFSLALPPGDVLTRDQWQEITADFMREMGLESHPHIAILHRDTEHQHIHIVGSRVDLDGEVWHGKFEAFRAIEATQVLEKRHGLTITAGLDSIEREQHKSKLTQQELGKMERTDEVPVRVALQQMVDEAAQGKPSVLAFIERLERSGVTVVPNIAGTGRLNGFSFEYQGIAFKGSQLGKAYSWSQLKERGVTYEQDAEGDELRRRRERAAAAASANGGPATAASPGRVGGHGEALGREPVDAGRAVGPDGRGAEGDPGRDGSSGHERGSSEQRGEPSANQDVADGGAGRLAGWSAVAAGVADLAAPAAAGGAVERSKGAGDDAVSKALQAKQRAWREQSSALAAPAYRITLKARRDELSTYNLGKGRAADGSERFYTAGEVEQLLPRLSRENARGFDVYVTPIDPAHHFLVIDDMQPGALERLRADGFAPCLVQSSSAGNEQAVLKLAKQPGEQKEANALVVELNRKYGDPNFSGVIHPFRLAGFANKKPGKGDVFTKVIEAAQRLCVRAGAMLAEIKAQAAAERQERVAASERPARAARPVDVPDVPAGALEAFRRSRARHAGLAVARGWVIDESRLDWAATLDALREGHAPADVAGAILALSPGLSVRHNNPADYASRTVENALREATPRQEERRSVDGSTETPSDLDYEPGASGPGL